ncbi:hypothetical protein JCM17846_03450 [Iodidimonas nitroreducens]|uniref:DUF962 domain-containing protein n=1 Tax=Iodidimonas nitroreducens TaxID=1236968 RepID=A0A5A7N323_9PROT|nr:DUF962 domain-containing protein [Iodidimonas nitroreducens]GAK32178.1 putative membrane protein [alpha proteobacterium Q-1]GER02663.1 hypothetical protein JCM17846_03450 [Iodidimonas nitroreducens]
MSERIESYGAFFLFYLREHARPLTRALHYAAAFASLAVLFYGLVIGPLWLVLLMPLAGYGLAWFAHFFIEKNRPATFQYPGWSLISDYVMTWLWLTGRLGPWLDKAGVARSKAPAHQR